MFALQTPEQEFAHPTLLYTGDNRISSKALCVKCGYVCVDVLDFTSGVTGLFLFSMYWGFQHRIHQLCGADTLIAATHDWNENENDKTRRQVPTALIARLTATTNKITASTEQAEKSD